jgi:hypothetical protein
MYKMPPNLPGDAVSTMPNKRKMDGLAWLLQSGVSRLSFSFAQCLRRYWNE